MLGDLVAPPLLPWNDPYPVRNIKDLLSRYQKQGSFQHFWSPTGVHFFLLCEKCVSHSTWFVSRSLISICDFWETNSPHQIRPFPMLCWYKRKAKNSAFILLLTLIRNNKMKKIHDGITPEGPVKGTK